MRSKRTLVTALTWCLAIAAGLSLALEAPVAVRVVLLVATFASGGWETVLRRRERRAGTTD